ncbi:actin-related protein 2/3 complex subunit 3-like [Histomonas meleagridis]|uniref:actin-related protein 2/3 complex subunit 3-like n=1 Tax=Histomonas meleagridis TaxID=135588 RepID=UPI00355A9A19|nr:actin-related protein 2/3 complex subunit 3-like [Histomonas meleagridis]KAH0799073.1 actin-related protein 2/3 complex subunit 3-like [Histomonas meleagridis]
MSKLPTEPAADSKNSVFVNTGAPVIAGIPILPIRDTSKRQTTPAFDIVDEALYHFRTNIFMRDFKIKNDADRLLIYITFFAMKCLKFFAKNPKDKAKCQKEIQSWSMNAFPIPGEGGFILASLVTAPKSNAEKADLLAFFKVVRNETANRLLDIVFKDGTADKWWICFAPRKFMDKEMAN